MQHIDSNLVIILAFIFALVASKQYFRWKRYKLWHDLARTALEKGQPLPKTELDSMLENGLARSRPRRMERDVRGGIALIGIAAGLYFALPAGVNSWAAIPAFIGVTCLLFGLLSFLLSDKPSDPQDRDPSAKK